MKIVITFQVLLLLYHQITTIFDFFPFNSARFYSAKEKLIECLVNFILMGLPIVGFLTLNNTLMNFAVVYYFILFLIELKTWWIPYFIKPTEEWKEEYSRLHSKTIIVLPGIKDNPVPNLEHCILHGLTLITAMVTLWGYSQL